VRRWVPWVGASLIGLALVLWLTGGNEGADTERVPPSPPVTPSQGSTGSATTPTSPPNQGFDFGVRLLPHQGRGARADSVHIGIAKVDPDQARAHERWVTSGGEGSGAADYSELATVVHWVKPPTDSVSDGEVIVGPVRLPVADRFDLEARSDDPLQFYRASFTASTAPAVIEPMLAAGLRVMREPLEGARVGILLRRVEGVATDPRWSRLQAGLAPLWLTAFDDTPWPLDPEATALAPLPPGPIDVVLNVNGIEAERRRIELVAGRWTDVRFDADSQAVAQAVSATLELTLVIAGTAIPVEKIAVTWFGEGGDQTRVSSADGQVRFEGADRQRAQRVSLQFPAPAGDLPEWPETLALELDLEGTGIESDGVWRKTVEVTPLSWLILRSTDVRIPAQRQGGNPYPIFVLQRLSEGQWLDAASDHFLPVPEGVAISVARAGEHRVMALRTPWTVQYSTRADTRPGDRNRHPVDLLPGIGERVEITVMHDDMPVANAAVAVRGPARSLPMLTRTTDGAGRLILEHVTVDEIRLEVAGYLTATVDARDATAIVELALDQEASTDPGE
jgi:hypothetical protein